MDLRPHISAPKPAPADTPRKRPAPKAAVTPGINLDEIPKLVLRDPAAVAKAQQAKGMAAADGGKAMPPQPMPRPKALAKLPNDETHAAIAPAKSAIEDAPKTAATAPQTATPEADKKAEAKAEASTPVAAAKADPPVDPEVIQQFCTNLSSAASSGRLAWQAKRLEEIEAKMRARITELEAKRKETAEWLAKREEMLKAAEEAVVAIYSKMRPDAAAAQFTAMDESGAAAILIKLNPRLASTILNEIEPGRAARIAAEMAGVGVRRKVARSVP